MSTRISISKRSALWILETIGHFEGPVAVRACQELAHALKPRPKRPSVKARQAKKKTKKEQTDEIREAVRARSGGKCELCPGAGMHLHHALGRGKAKQSEANCLWICHNCHHCITVNSPSAAYWLDAQAKRFHELGHRETLRALDARLDFVRARAELTEGLAP